MNSILKKDLTKILKRYLNYVVYIDDEFKISWEAMEEDVDKKQSRSSRNLHGNHPVSTKTEYSEHRSGLENFCQYIQNKYPEILLTPILYTPSMSQEQILAHMSNARMLILDWSLTERITAVNLLQKADFSGQLKFCVIYTSKLDDAKEMFFKEIKNVRQQGTQKETYRGKEYEYVRADSVMYMLCEKDKFDIGMIVDAFVEIFIKEIGYFPIAFIDMISRLEEKVPYYLNKFSYPFDKLLLLQTSDDGLPLDDVYHTISDMVFNNIRADIELDQSVLENIYEQQLYILRELLKDDEIFQEQLNRSLEYILERLDCGDEDKEIFRKITSEEYKEIVKKAISEPYDLSKGIAKACQKMVKLCSEHKAGEVLQKNGVCEISFGSLKKELSRAYKNQYEKKITGILPACLMILANPEQSYNINSLITSLKTVGYDENERYFKQIFSGCYEEKEGTMFLKTTDKGPSGLALLQNKLKPGDILFKEGEEGICYLCIVPSCHLLRPKKVEGNIIFVKGRIVKHRPKQMLRDSEHFTILPGIEDENVPIRVIWQYHRIAEIDLNRIPSEDFVSWFRPYRLSYEYIRQLVGEFVAFYSKSGVEELFIESDASLEHLLIADGINKNDE